MTDKEYFEDDDRHGTSLSHLVPSQPDVQSNDQNETATSLEDTGIRRLREIARDSSKLLTFYESDPEEDDVGNKHDERDLEFGQESKIPESKNRSGGADDAIAGGARVAFAGAAARTLNKLLNDDDDCKAGSGEFAYETYSTRHDATEISANAAFEPAEGAAAPSQVMFYASGPQVCDVGNKHEKRELGFGKESNIPESECRSAGSDEAVAGGAGVAIADAAPGASKKMLNEDDDEFGKAGIGKGAYATYLTRQKATETVAKAAFGPDEGAAAPSQVMLYGSGPQVADVGNRHDERDLEFGEEMKLPESEYMPPGGTEEAGAAARAAARALNKLLNGDDDEDYKVGNSKDACANYPSALQTTRTTADITFESAKAAGNEVKMAP